MAATVTLVFTVVATAPAPASTPPLPAVVSARLSSVPVAVTVTEPALSATPSPMRAAVRVFERTLAVATPAAVTPPASLFAMAR